MQGTSRLNRHQASSRDVDTNPSLVTVCSSLSCLLPGKQQGRIQPVDAEHQALGWTAPGGGGVLVGVGTGAAKPPAGAAACP